MGRKTLVVEITDEGRDKGKNFIITEMSASQAEKWAMRAFLALMEAGVEVPDGIFSMGFAGIAVWGIQALGGLSWEKTEPLMDEMWECLSFLPDPKVPKVTRRLVEDDVEEVKTRMTLRKQIIALHTDFFTAAANSTPRSTATVSG